MNKNKKRNKRFARRSAMRLKHGVSERCAKRDSIRASRRNWGQGAGK